MGKRSRKRAAEGSSRAERDAARRQRRVDAIREGKSSPVPRTRPGRPSRDERPAAPWGGFPLSELVVLLGLALMLWGLFSWGSTGNVRFGAGLGLAGLAGVELSLREHLAGFRSHTTLLAGVLAFAVVTGLALGPGPHQLGALLIIGGLVFGGTFYALRELFRKRSGGLSFR